MTEVLLNDLATPFLQDRFAVLFNTMIAKPTFSMDDMEQLDEIADVLTDRGFVIQADEEGVVFLEGEPAGHM